jgi:hypothetical protein
MMNFSEAPEFARDVKQLAKKWRSLPGDINDAKAAIEPLYVEQPGVVIDEYRKLFLGGKMATIIYEDDANEVVKMRLDCESLSTNSKLRLVFVYVKTMDGITLMELFNKADKPREDTKRWQQYLNQ